ncbi:oxidoreductase of aldo/keto reductase family, subgroup 1, partial [Reticulomyxa filosa]
EQQLLDTMKLDYFDLYLIHSPVGGENLKTYQALMDLQGKDKIKSIGKSQDQFVMCFTLLTLFKLKSINSCNLKKQYLSIFVDNFLNKFIIEYFVIFKTYLSTNKFEEKWLKQAAYLTFFKNYKFHTIDNGILLHYLRFGGIAQIPLKFEAGLKQWNI